MNRPVVAGLFLVVALVAGSVAGCSSVMQTLQDTFEQRPTAKVTATRLSDIDLRSVTMQFDIEVDNPYSFDLPLLNLDFGLSTNGQDFLDGTSEVGGTVPAQGKRTIALPVRVDLVGLIDTVKGLRPGQVIPYDAELGLKVEVTGMGPMRLPLQKSGELPIPDVPSVEVSSLDWDQLSLNTVSGTLLLAIGNTNEFPFSLNSLDYDLSLSNTSVARGENRDALQLEAGESGNLTIPISFSPGVAGLALLNGLRDGETDYSILGRIAIETPFGPMDLPLKKSGAAAQGL
jgi:LEA14-like dessication related protein